MSYVPRGLAFDILFGSNSMDGHAAIDAIYEGFDEELELATPGKCKDCIHSERIGSFMQCTHLKTAVSDAWFCGDFMGKEDDSERSI